MLALRAFTAAAVFVCAATMAAAGPIKLTPADPQPAADALAEGLAVSYAFPPDVKSLRDAEYFAKEAKSGEPLLGFDYIDTEEGEPTLTSGQSIQVVAKISGFLKFDAPGVYEVDFISNDGLRVHIGGQEVSEFDGRHPCENAGVVQVEAPVAGWYPLEALYFQRKGTACLLAEWTPPGGELDWIPNENTAYLK